MSANYLLAKHIPDMHRFEPRNIGVIVWMPGGEVAARFLAEKPGRPGEIDGRSIPPFVGADGAYRQWIKFWRSYLDADHPTHPLTGAPIDRNDSAFIESLVAASRGHFLLAEGGAVLDEMEEDSIGALADSLYASLVEDQALEEARDPTLNQICERLIGNAGLYLDQNFKPHYQVACRVGGVEERYEFSYAYKNGTLCRSGRSSSRRTRDLPLGCSSMYSGPESSRTRPTLRRWCMSRTRFVRTRTCSGRLASWPRSAA
jgi:hypothetical protein